MHCVHQKSSPGPQAIRLIYSPLAPTFDSGPQTTAFSWPAGRPSVILPARLWSADHNFLPARRPSVYYTARRHLPLILIRRPQLSRPAGRLSAICPLAPTLFGPQITALSPFPQAVRLLYCRMAPTFDSGLLTTDLSLSPQAVLSVIVPAGPLFDYGPQTMTLSTGPQVVRRYTAR